RPTRLSEPKPRSDRVLILPSLLERTLLRVDLDEARLKEVEGGTYEALDCSGDRVADSHESRRQRAGPRPLQGGHGVVQPEGRSGHQGNAGSAEHEQPARSTAIYRHADRHEQARDSGFTGTVSSAGPVDAAAWQQPIRRPLDRQQPPRSSAV